MYLYKSPLKFPMPTHSPSKKELSKNKSELEIWQINRIKKANQGLFASEEKVKKAFQKWKNFQK